MAIYLSRKKGVTSTSITPSNATPAALTANSPVTPTTAGYAVRSYDSITPSDSSPVRMYEDSIYKTNSSGYAVGNVNNVTPSDYAPPRLFQGSIYKPLAHGYLYSSQQVVPTSIVPSDSSPVALTANTPVNPMANGYAISSYDTVTPSNTNPPILDETMIYKLTGAGVLYSGIQKKVKIGTVTTSTTATTYVNIGFKPKYIAFVDYKDSTHLTLSIYNQDISTGATYRGAVNGSNMNCATFALPTSTGTSNAAKILSIDSTGFTIDKTSTTFGTNGYYFAIG